MNYLENISSEELRKELERRERLDKIYNSMQIINEEIEKLRGNGIEVFSHLEEQRFILKSLYYNPYLDKLVYIEE